MLPLLAQIVGGYSIASFAIWLIIVVAVLAILWIVIKQSGVPIPQWVWSILGILLLAVVGVVAIKFLMGVV